MKKISILTPADIAEAYQIEQASHAFPWTKNVFASNHSEHYLNYKLSVNHCLAGFSMTQLIIDEATLFNIAIDPQYQRQGYGRLLLEYLIKQLIIRHVATCWLEVRQSNLGAIALYKSLNFKAVSVRKNYYPCTKGSENAVIMKLSLA
ncbi:ribosomal protein S18-alanine N-acetyltransferase [Candidatus Regiella endosymbiont of Tuberolachnus salignus]|uniref:ribosomal protein S18-alanine N-acetyltransferase n=1 Tax=Candidatus Regiella endosymbiont of Tuberolachnus salignus TaxID=3077956 RepID=UPI0030D4EB1D